MLRVEFSLIGAVGWWKSSRISASFSELILCSEIKILLFSVGVLFVTVSRDLSCF